MIGWLLGLLSGALLTCWALTGVGWMFVSALVSAALGLLLAARGRK